ncbi:hypothetical protein V5O48_008717 [Marasmius crinis-equi]|uniref:Uncharacterized protein n=1 Tax=Marasmius crinis-equi TaxID=585013 RepID=A0ABR3FDN1_9AGAR
MARTKASSARERSSKQHVRNRAEYNIPPPRISVQDWSSAPSNVPALYEDSIPEFGSWRPELPPSCLTSGSRGRNTTEQHAQGSTSRTNRRVTFLTPDIDSSSSQHICSSPASQKTLVEPQSLVLKPTSPDENSYSPPCDGDSLENDCIKRFEILNKIMDSSPQLRFLMSDFDPFASSDSTYSIGSPDVMSSRPIDLVETLPLFFSASTTSCTSDVLLSAPGLLYDGSAPWVCTSVPNGSINPVTLPLFSRHPESPVKRCKRYKQTVACKRSQALRSSTGSLESIFAGTSLAFDTSDTNPSSSTRNSEHKPEIRMSKMIYPELFDFGMYNDIFGPSESLVGLASLGTMPSDINDSAYWDDITKLLIPPSTRSDSGATEVPSTPGKREGVKFETEILGNTTNSTTSPPKNIYRSAAYSKALGMQQGVSGPGSPQQENQIDEMRKTVLHNTVQRMSRRSRGSPKRLVGSAKRRQGSDLNRDRGSVETSALSIPDSVVSFGGVSSQDSIDDLSDSLDTNSAITERLREASWDMSWDKTMFKCNENEFSEISSHSP